LGSKNSCTTGNSKEKNNQQKENLISQSKRGNGGFTQLSDHQHVNHIYASRNKLLKGNGDGKPQHGAGKFFVMKKREIHSRPKKQFLMKTQKLL